MPRRSNSSGCFRGSSIISRMRCISPSKPPTSSYVTEGATVSLDSLVSVFTISSVWSPTTTIPCGTVVTTVNGRNPPMRAMLGMMISSPFTSGLDVSPLRNRSSTPVPKRTCFPEGIFGATVILVAGRDSAFFTVTFSPMETTAFERIIPSILMMPFDSSSWAARKTLAAVLRLPTISIMSPTSTASSFLVLASMRARPKPTSDW